MICRSAPTYPLATVVSALSAETVPASIAPASKSAAAFLKMWVFFIILSFLGFRHIQIILRFFRRDISSTINNKFEGDFGNRFLKKFWFWVKFRQFD